MSSMSVLYLLNWFIFVLCDFNLTWCCIELMWVRLVWYETSGSIWLRITYITGWEVLWTVHVLRNVFVSFLIFILCDISIGFFFLLWGMNIIEYFSCLWMEKNTRLNLIQILAEIQNNYLIGFPMPFFLRKVNR